MTDKNLFVNFTLFIRKFIVFIVAPAGYIRNVGFLLLKIVIFIIVAAVTKSTISNGKICYKNNKNYYLKTKICYENHKNYYL